MYGCSEEDACQHNIQEILVQEGDDISVTSSEKESLQDLRAVSHTKAILSGSQDILTVLEIKSGFGRKVKFIS